jgi:hypothetical protein
MRTRVSRLQARFAMGARCASSALARIGRRVERRAERVAARLEDATVVIVDAVPQQSIVACERSAHRRGVRFP